MATRKPFSKLPEIQSAFSCKESFQIVQELKTVEH